MTKKFSLSLFLVLVSVGLSVLWIPAEASTNVTCYATHDDGTTVFSGINLAIVQSAVYQASPGDTVKIAGTCTGIDPTRTAGIHIVESVTLQGGYSPTDWTTPDPINQPTTLDANQEGRVILVSSAPLADTSVTFENLIISNGVINTGSNLDWGGGIYFDNGSRLLPYKATLRNVSLKNNSAWKGGSGIYGNYIEITIEDSEIIDNFAINGNGAGAYLSCDPQPNYTCAGSRIENTVFAGNTATYLGGAIFIDKGTYHLDTVTLEENGLVNNGKGAGIFNDTGDVSINNSTFLRNDADLNSSDSYYGHGGAIYNEYILSVMNSEFDGNIAGHGGAIYAKYSVIGQTPSISNSQFTNNLAIKQGGAIYNDSRLAISDSQFDSNEATSDGQGGAISNSGSLTIINSQFDNNKANSNNILYGAGGAIYNTRTVTITDSQFDGNSAQRGGALFAGGAQGSSIFSSAFINNSAEYDGGAIYNEGRLELEDTAIDSNHANRRGGGIHHTAWGNGEAFIERTTISRNTVTDPASGGGGIYNQADMTLVNSTVSGNIAETPTLRSAELSESEVHNLLATSGGGGILNHHTITLTHVTIADNVAESVGGYDFGGGIHNADIGELNMTNVLSADNIGGDCVQRATLATNITNMIEDGGCSAQYTGDPILGPLTNNGGPTETHALALGSLAVDSASTTTPLTSEDQRGVSRPQIGAADIGAYELSLVPLAVDLTNQATSSPAISTPFLSLVTVLLILTTLTLPLKKVN